MAFYYTVLAVNPYQKIWRAFTVDNAAGNNFMGPSDCFWIVPGTVTP